MKQIITLLMLLTALSAGAQGWEWSDRFQTDFFDGNKNIEVEFVKCPSKKGEESQMSTMEAYNCMKRDVQGGFWSGAVVIPSMKANKTGLYGKVANGVAAAKPTRTAPTSARQAQRMGKNYNHQTSDAHLAWLADKRAKQIQAQRAAEERRRQEKIADDLRASRAEAQANANLQPRTNQLIERDRYNATEGARVAQQRARQATRATGPQFNRVNPKLSAQDKARMLRGQVKPKRIMYPQRQKQNTVRKQLAKVERQPTAQERIAMLRKALMVREELRRKKKAEQAYANYNGIKLDDHAVSTLGRDWTSDDYKPLPPPPSPVAKVQVDKNKKTEKMMKEFNDSKPMTTEEWRQLVYDEIISTL